MVATPKLEGPRQAVASTPVRAYTTAAGGPRTAPVFAVWPVLVVLVAKCALNFTFAGRYGWQRDEPYYAVAGRHLQGGYVDFAPVTALLSAAARGLFGWSLVGFRGFAILAGAVTVVLAALIARELGGGRRAQVIAAAAVAFSPRLLASNGLFQPVAFDLAATMLVLWLALRLALGRGPGSRSAWRLVWAWRRSTRSRSCSLCSSPASPPGAGTCSRCAASFSPFSSPAR
jgi:hypothetical protein